MQSTLATSTTTTTTNKSQSPQHPYLSRLICIKFQVRFPSVAHDFSSFALASYCARTYLSKNQGAPWTRSTSRGERETESVLYYSTNRITALEKWRLFNMSWQRANAKKPSCRRVGLKSSRKLGRRNKLGNDNRHFSGKILEFGEENSRPAVATRTPSSIIERWWKGDTCLKPKLIGRRIREVMPRICSTTSSGKSWH